MKNADFLAKILSSNETYWVVQFRMIGASSHEFVSVAMVAFPASVHLSTNESDIRYIDLKSLQRLELPNVYLSEDYPPFQYNITLYDAHDGFPVTANKKKFLQIALNAKPTKDLYFYKELHNELIKEETPL